jgi:hypothetical protein
MDKILIEEISRNKKLMGLNEDTIPSKVSVSSDGIVNFWDLSEKKVYRYRLVATTKITKDMDVEVKSINIEDGTIEYVDPEKGEIKVEKITEEAKNNIINNYKNGRDIENLHSFKERGFNVTIKLEFVETQPINIK